MPKKRKFELRSSRLLTLLLVPSLSACAANQAILGESHSVEAVSRSRVELVESGQRAARRGDWIRAEQYYQSALAAGVESEALTRMSINACVRAGRYRAASEHAERYLQTHPDSSEVRYLLGALLLALSEPGPAFEQLRTVVSSAPEHAQAHYALGVLHREFMGDGPTAIDHFEEYLRLAPRGAYAARVRVVLKLLASQIEVQPEAGPNGERLLHLDTSSVQNAQQFGETSSRSGVRPNLPNEAAGLQPTTDSTLDTGFDQETETAG